MAKTEYVALTGIDFPPNKRIEAGEVVSDLPKEAVAWLLESKAIQRKGAASEKETPQAVEVEAVEFEFMTDEELMEALDKDEANNDI
jgi:hypothetical protein